MGLSELFRSKTKVLVSQESLFPLGNASVDVANFIAQSAGADGLDIFPTHEVVRRSLNNAGDIGVPAGGQHGSWKNEIKNKKKAGEPILKIDHITCSPNVWPDDKRTREAQHLITKRSKAKVVRHFAPELDGESVWEMYGQAFPTQLTTESGIHVYNADTALQAMEEMQRRIPGLTYCYDTSNRRAQPFFEAIGIKNEEGRKKFLRKAAKHISVVHTQIADDTDLLRVMGRSNDGWDMPATYRVLAEDGNVSVHVLELNPKKIGLLRKLVKFIVGL